jgi:hypothetical protein
LIKVEIFPIAFGQNRRSFPTSLLAGTNLVTINLWGPTMAVLADSIVESEYKDRYVAFLDLLGFKALVESAEVDASEQARLKEVLDLLSRTLCNNPHLGTRFSHFSDCIVITSDVSPAALQDIFRSVETLTRNILQFDVFVRGGITRGGAFHSQHHLYGTAVSRAALTEKEAQGPLTLLSPEVYADAKELGQELLRWVESDGANRFFVHYLINYAEYHRTPKLPGKVILDTDAERIAFFISRRLLNDSGDVLAKAQWFQSNWNRTVARQNGFGEIMADPSLAEPGEPRTRIVRRMFAPTRSERA